MSRCTKYGGILVSHDNLKIKKNQLITKSCKTILRISHELDTSEIDFPGRELSKHNVNEHCNAKIVYLLITTMADCYYRPRCYEMCRFPIHIDGFDNIYHII